MWLTHTTDKSTQLVLNCLSAMSQAKKIFTVYNTKSRRMCKNYMVFIYILHTTELIGNSGDMHQFKNDFALVLKTKLHNKDTGKPCRGFTHLRRFHGVSDVKSRSLSESCSRYFLPHPSSERTHFSLVILMATSPAANFTIQVIIGEGSLPSLPTKTSHQTSLQLWLDKQCTLSFLIMREWIIQHGKMSLR